MKEIQYFSNRSWMFLCWKLPLSMWSLLQLFYQMVSLLLLTMNLSDTSRVRMNLWIVTIQIRLMLLSSNIYVAYLFYHMWWPGVKSCAVNLQHYIHSSHFSFNICVIIHLYFIVYKVNRTPGGSGLEHFPVACHLYESCFMINIVFCESFVIISTFMIMHINSSYTTYTSQPQPYLLATPAI